MCGLSASLTSPPLSAHQGRMSRILLRTVYRLIQIPGAVNCCFKNGNTSRPKKSKLLFVQCSILIMPACAQRGAFWYLLGPKEALNTQYWTLIGHRMRGTCSEANAANSPDQMEFSRLLMREANEGQVQAWRFWSFWNWTAESTFLKLQNLLSSHRFKHLVLMLLWKA